MNDRPRATPAKEGVPRQPRRRPRFPARHHSCAGGPMAPSHLTALGGHHVFSTAIPLLLFCGAVGKSAQLPLQIWLPDAMEGPVARLRSHPRGDDGLAPAGVYMLCRIPLRPSPVPGALTVITGGPAPRPRSTPRSARSRRAISRRCWPIPRSLSSATWWRPSGWDRKWSP